MDMGGAPRVWAQVSALSEEVASGSSRLLSCRKGVLGIIPA